MEMEMIFVSSVIFFGGWVGINFQVVHLLTGMVLDPPWGGSKKGCFFKIRFLPQKIESHDQILAKF